MLLYYLFYDTKCDVNSIKKFGCFWYIRKDNVQKLKLKFKINSSIFLKIADESKEVRVYLSTYYQI